MRQPAGETGYTFDAEDQLVGVATPVANISYDYDANGERTGRGDGSGVISYLVDPASPTGASQVLADYNASGIQAQTIFANRLVSRDNTTQTRFYHQDASRNLRLLSDESGLASDRYNYSAYGDVIARSGTTNNPYAFAGERFDDATGLTYLRARHYDASSGRFLSRDPFEGVRREPLTLHRYLYGNANPVAFVDPSGELAVPSASQLLAVNTILIVLLTVEINIPKSRRQACTLGGGFDYVGSVIDIDGPLLEIRRASVGDEAQSTGIELISDWQTAVVSERLFIGDELRTDSATTAVVRFLIGGKAGISRGQTAQVASQDDINVLDNGRPRVGLRGLAPSGRSFQIQSAGGACIEG